MYLTDSVLLLLSFLPTKLGKSINISKLFPFFLHCSHVFSINDSDKERKGIYVDKTENDRLPWQTTGRNHVVFTLISFRVCQSLLEHFHALAVGVSHDVDALLERIDLGTVYIDDAYDLCFSLCAVDAGGSAVGVVVLSGVRKRSCHAVLRTCSRLDATLWSLVRVVSRTVNWDE